MCADYEEYVEAAHIRDLDNSAWEAYCNGQDDLAESINRELCEARVHYAERG